MLLQYAVQIFGYGPAKNKPKREKCGQKANTVRQSINFGIVKLHTSLYFKNWRHFMASTFTGLDSRGLYLVEVSQSPKRMLLGPPLHPGNVNPHYGGIWHDYNA
jgi:hypothetical protein